MHQNSINLTPQEIQQVYSGTYLSIDSSNFVVEFFFTSSNASLGLTFLSLIAFFKISWISYAVALIAGIGIRLTVDNGASDWSVVIGALLLAGAVIAFHSVATNISDAIRGVFNGVMLLLALVSLYLATIYI